MIKNIYLIYLFLIVAFYLTIFNKASHYLLNFSIFNFFIAGFSIFFYIKILMSKRNYEKILKSYLLGITIIIIFCFFKIFLAYENISSAFSSFIRVAILPCLVFLPYIFKINNKLLIILRLIPYICLPLAFFGIIQSLFSGTLPDFLLNYKIQGERIDQFIFGDFILFRSNGLFGNPLEYSVFLSFIICIFLNYRKYSHTKNIAILTIFISAIMATLSRSAIISSLIISFYLLMVGQSSSIRIFLNILFLALLITISVNTDFPQLAALVERLSGSDESIASTETRLDYLYLTIAKITQFPYFLTGYDLGRLTSGSEEIPNDIQDGYFFNLIIDLGVPVFLLYIVLHIKFLIKGFILLKNKNTKNYGRFMITIIFLWIFFSIFNSAMLNTSCIILFYLSIGFTLKLASLVVDVNKNKINFNN